MQTFYTILYCPIRPIIDEQLSIGLLAREGNKFFFKFSSEKLKILKELLPLPAYNLLKASLKNIDRFIEENKVNGASLFSDFNEIEDSSTYFLSKKYVDYLNNYTNNLLHFSSPKDIDIELSYSSFEMLYRKFIFSSDLIVSPVKSTELKVIKEVINPIIKDHVNLDVELTSQQIPELIVPTPLWFIGKNDQDVTGEVINFDKSPHYLENDIREHLYLLQSLRSSKKDYHGKHFLVGSQPDKSNESNYSIWENLRNLPYISFLNFDEVEVITEYIKKHDVEPYFTEQNEQ